VCSSDLGLATFVSILAGSVLLIVWVRRKHEVLALEPRHWRPDFTLWRRMLGIGLPSGGEFFLMSVYAGLIYYLSRPFGANAQAGFGVGMRVLQTGFMPAVAVAFSVAPIAGQNYGAGRLDRVRETLRVGLAWNSAVMLVFMAICHFFPEPLLGPFAGDPEVIAAGAGMLAILSFNFLASGAVLVASGLFQALGNTLPSLLVSASRILLFALPALWLARQPGFQLNQLWWLSVVSVLFQAVLALWLLQREMRAKGV
jgi:Na+-driven multidrug efflux pump